MVYFVRFYLVVAGFCYDDLTIYVFQVRMYFIAIIVFNEINENCKNSMKKMVLNTFTQVKRTFLKASKKRYFFFCLKTMKVFETQN